MFIRKQWRRKHELKERRKCTTWQEKREGNIKESREGKEGT